MLLDDIITQAGVDVRRVDSAERMLPCPFCVGLSDVSGERKILGVNVENGKAHCLRCDWRSGSVVYTAKALCEAYGIEFSWRLRLSASEADVAASAQHVEEIVEPEPIGFVPEYEAFGDGTDEIERLALDYLESRKVTREEIEKYKIGYAVTGDFAWRVMFPIFGEDGEVYGMSGRDFSGKSKLKYRNTEGVKMLWNGQHPAQRAVVGEGVMDALAIDRAAWRFFRHTVGMAALGSVLTHYEIAQLMKYKSVVHFGDFDVAGVKGVVKKADATAAAGIETFVVVPKKMDGRDPGEMDGDTIAQYIRGALPWSKATEMRLRLSMLRF